MMGRYVPKSVIAVDLFGQPAEYESIRKICSRYGLFLLEDGAQGFGGSIGSQKACSFRDISTTSFFPAKPLGCYGDGGAVFTDNDEWSDLIRSYAVHGKSGNDKYDNVRIGMNSRLDTLQAAILQVKLDAFIKYELDDINEIADEYRKQIFETGLGDILFVPVVQENFRSSWAQFTIQLPSETDRSGLQNKLKNLGIPTMVYYVRPMHKQGAFTNGYSSAADCQVTERLCKTVLSLPIYPYMKKNDIETVVNGIRDNLV